MERRFIMNEFERSLKEHADKFQMVPSKKVWHGIYNDLHPGKRWPSVTMSLLLIFTLVVIGHLNTNNTNNSRHLAYLSGKSSESKKSTAVLKRTANPKNNQRVVVRATDLDKSREMFVYSTGQSNNTGLTTGITVMNYQNNNVKDDRLPADNVIPLNNPGSSPVEKKLVFTPKANATTGDNILAENVPGKVSRLQNNIDADQIMNETPEAGIGEVNSVSPNISKKTTTEKKYNSNSEERVNKNIDGISYAGKTPDAEKKIAKLHKKRNEKVTWVYFAAPAVSSVSFGGAPLKPSPPANFSPGLAVNPKDNQVIHNSALGLEAGAQLNYAFTKKLKFIVGIHFTYSGYNIVSNEVHPTPAILVLKDHITGTLYSESFLTHFGDGTGQAVVTLHNYSWQASIPFGLQYEFAGNKKVQFNIGADVEPSLVLKNNAYILSSDGNNYVNDPSLLRKWNVNSNFGAFVTFNSIKFKWQIGPNLRYQWLSTYRKDYTVKEHLIDYGIRIGISR